MQSRCTKSKFKIIPIYIGNHKTIKIYQKRTEGMKRNSNNKTPKTAFCKNVICESEDTGWPNG